MQSYKYRNRLFNLESWLTTASIRKLAEDKRNLTLQRSNLGNTSVKLGPSSKEQLNPRKYRHRSLVIPSPNRSSPCQKKEESTFRSTFTAVQV